MKLDREAIARAHGWPSWARVVADSRRDGYTENGGRGPAAVAISRIAANAEKLMELVEAYDSPEHVPPAPSQPLPLSADEESNMRRDWRGYKEIERVFATLDAARRNTSRWGIWDQHRERWVTREVEMTFLTEAEAQEFAGLFDTKDGRRYYEARLLPERCPACGAAPCTLATAQCVAALSSTERMDLP
jgi:hypothetical protein